MLRLVEYVKDESDYKRHINKAWFLLRIFTVLLNVNR